jgi:preprotein translocase subunit SecE
MNKIVQYLRDVRLEMTKVSWPNRDEIVGGTTLVIALSLIISVFVKICDFSLSKIVALIIKM